MVWPIPGWAAAEAVSKTAARHKQHPGTTPNGADRGAGLWQLRDQQAPAGSCGYRASPNEVTSRSMVDPLRRNDFIYGVVVTPFDEAL
jgi:hypothetical protein